MGNIWNIYWTHREREATIRRMTTKKAAASETGDPLLLTPGPLTTSTAVKQAMVHDWGSRDAEFLRINRMVLDKIVERLESGQAPLDEAIGKYGPRGVLTERYQGGLGSSAAGWSRGRT